MAEPKEIGTVWTLGCEVFVEDALTSEVQEIKVNDIVLSANIFTEGLSVEVGSDRVNAMDLDVRISMDGLKTYIIDSQIVPYEDVLKITDFSPEATNEKRYASSANTSKKIIDSVGELEGRVNLTEGDIDALGKRVDDLELKGTGGSGDGFWYLNEQDGKIHTDIGIVVHGNAIIEGDTSSGGEGQDTPAAGLDEQAILDLLEREKYVTEDDIEGLIPDVDLSEYAKTEDVETAISEVGEEIDSLSTLLLSMWHLDDNGNLVTDKQVLIKNNLIIDGDTSSGGEGEDTPSGGISGVKVNGVTYYDDNGDGVIDLGTISGGGGTADLSNYYTKAESDARYLAQIGGIIDSDSVEPLILNTTASSVGLRLRINNINKTYFGYSASVGTYMYNYGSGYYLGVGDDGIPYFHNGNYNTLIHSGNIGSYALTLGGGEISGLILPSAHNNYALGGWNQSFASIYANQFWSGAANNNLWLIGGSYDTIGLVFAQSNDGGNTSILGEWTSKGLCVGGSTPTRTFNVVSPDFTCMSVERNQPSGYGAVIEFYNTANKLGQIGWDNEYAFLIADTSGKSLISGRYDYLNIGDYFAISNTETNPFIIITHGGYNWYIQGFQSNYLYIGAGSTKSLRIKYNGEVYCPQNLIVSGDTSSGSDIRFKDVIKNKTIKIEHIAKAPLFTFKWNDREDDSVHLGSSAQYWEKVTPWLVKGEDFKTLDYSTLGVAMGISLAKKAVNHEERIKVLEKEIKRLKEEMIHG